MIRKEGRQVYRQLVRLINRYRYVVRDLSEISRGGGGVETEGGSQLFETLKREGS